MHNSYPSSLYFFDPKEDFTIFQRQLPHWSQPGVVTFITIRTHDSFPREALMRFHADRRHWLRCHQINPDAEGWRQKLEELDRKQQREFFATFSTRWHDTLDSCAGSCPFRRPQLRSIVAQSLLHFDKDRYEMLDFVIMPNHIHLLAAFPTDDMLLTQCESWKQFTATQINRQLARKGRFWQQDGFDHLVRSLEQYEHFRKYIANNPAKANLSASEYFHYTK